MQLNKPEQNKVDLGQLRKKVKEAFDLYNNFHGSKHDRIWVEKRCSLWSQYVSLRELYMQQQALEKGVPFFPMPNHNNFIKNIKKDYIEYN
jgi:hypothetical protein